LFFNQGGIAFSFRRLISPHVGREPSPSLRVPVFSPSPPFGQVIEDEFPFLEGNHPPPPNYTPFLFDVDFRSEKPGFPMEANIFPFLVQSAEAFSTHSPRQLILVDHTCSSWPSSPLSRRFCTSSSLMLSSFFPAAPLLGRTSYME